MCAAPTYRGIVGSVSGERKGQMRHETKRRQRAAALQDAGAGQWLGYQDCQRARIPGTTGRTSLQPVPGCQFPADLNTLNNRPPVRSNIIDVML